MKKGQTKKERKDEIAKEGFRVGRNWGPHGLDMLGPIDQHYERRDEQAAFLSGFECGCFSREADFHLAQAEAQLVKGRAQGDFRNCSTA